MSTYNMFSSPVFTDSLIIDNISLEEFCREKIFNSKNYLNKCITQSGHLNLNDPALVPLVENIQDRMNKFHLSLGLSKNYKSVIYQGWTTLDNNYATCIPHNHIGAQATFSCVYYVKSNSDSGSLEFINPNLIQPRVILPEYIENFNEFTSTMYAYKPIPGDLIIFPAWLYHYIKQGTGNGERISIAFNIKIIPN